MVLYVSRLLYAFLVLCTAACVIGSFAGCMQVPLAGVCPIPNGQMNMVCVGTYWFEAGTTLSEAVPACPSSLGHRRYVYVVL